MSADPPAPPGTTAANAGGPAGEAPEPNPRVHGRPPYRIAVIHGGPGAGGEMAPVARRLSAERGVLEPIQTAASLEGQIAELTAVLSAHAEIPATLVGFSWGAWLSFLVAARHPAFVRKVILVGSGPFEESYVARLEATRRGRLNLPERAEYAAILKALDDPTTPEKDRPLARLGQLASITDSFDPVATEISVERAGLGAAPSAGEIFQKVWSEASALRRTGTLLESGKLLRCPVVAIHGAHDPHPAEGVRDPLARVVKDFRFVLLAKCGHKPWIERQAREEFYAILRDELPRPADPGP